MSFQTTNPGINHPWPLGQITVTTAGTPVQLTVNVKTGAPPANPQGSQLWLLNTHATATIYLMAGNFAKNSNLDQVVWQLPAGGYIFISATALGQDAITSGNYYLDSSVSGGTCLATVWQGSGG